MGWTLDDITNVCITEYAGTTTVTAVVTHTDKVIQCYVSGELVDVQTPSENAVTFYLSAIREFDIIFLVAADVDDGATNYWDAAYPLAGATYGNRINIRTPQTIAPYLPSDRWRIYIDDVLAHEQDFYPGERAGGFGVAFGYGGFGWDGYDCLGFGYNFGYGEFGFDCEMLEWESDPKAAGAYNVKVHTADSAGNESTADETDVTLATYVRPATDLTVDSYTYATDTLALSFTASEDVA